MSYTGPVTGLRDRLRIYPQRPRRIGETEEEPYPKTTEKDVVTTSFVTGPECPGTKDGLERPRETGSTKGSLPESTE